MTRELDAVHDDANTKKLMRESQHHRWEATDDTIPGCPTCLALAAALDAPPVGRAEHVLLGADILGWCPYCGRHFTRPVLDAKVFRCKECDR